jgi:translation initiation factor 6 (eIF-6)
VIIRKPAFGTDFIGLFLLFAGDTLLRPWRMPNKEVPEGIESKPLKAESDMLGIFFAANSHGLVGSMEAEGATVLDTKFTAVGNLVRANDHGAIISPLLDGAKGEIEEALGVPATVTTVAGLNLAGSLTLANNHGAVVHPNATPGEMETIGRALGVPAHYGTLVKSGFLGSMGAVSDGALLVSPSAMPPELAQIAEILEID